MYLVFSKIKRLDVIFCKTYDIYPELVKLFEDQLIDMVKMNILKIRTIRYLQS